MGTLRDEACPRNRSRHVLLCWRPPHAVLYHDRLFRDLQHCRRAGGAWLAPRNEILWMLMMAVIGFGVMVPSPACWRTHLAVGKAWSSLPLMFSSRCSPCRCWVRAIQRAVIRVPVDGYGAQWFATFGPMERCCRSYFRRSALYRRIVFLQCIIDSPGASVAPYIYTHGCKAALRAWRR